MAALSKLRRKSFSTVGLDEEAVDDDGEADTSCELCKD